AFANLNDHQPLEKQSSQNQTSSRTKKTVASSAAALVSDTAYRQTNFIRQHTISKSVNENDKPLIWLNLFVHPPSVRAGSSKNTARTWV
ncbi:hypothetical protein MUU53_16790, partial [Rhizobium lemnae]|uniref:hypothetical protein n=1 Tax=Rhizobium lemnae TaxID=1214924 RepID=UPI001FF2ED60